MGFSYLPGGANSKTTIRGGFGMFADYFPAQIMGDLIANVPSVDRFTVNGAAYTPLTGNEFGKGGNLIPIDASMTGSGHDGRNPI